MASTLAATTTTTTNTSSGIGGGGGGGGGNETTRQRLVHQTSGLNSANCCICSKFVPQAFNPNKCQQCFNLKDIHSAEALAEFSKVTIELFLFFFGFSKF